MSKIDPKQRFSNRVNDYHKHRPSYPREIINILKDENTFPQDSVVADIGSGTGMLTQLFFNDAKTVYGIEPNDAMRHQAEKDFYNVNNFVSIDGSAENTTLPPASIDLLTAAQAFHWFDRDKAYNEFKRILKPNGYIMLIWNYRDFESDNLQQEYEDILKTHISDYKKLDHKTITDQKIYDFYQTTNIIKYTLANFQLFDLESLNGRILSSSYIPKRPNPITSQILEKVEILFDKFQVNGHVHFVYKTNMYLGQLH